MNTRLLLGWSCTLLLGCNIELPADPIPADEAQQTLATQICEQLYTCGCTQTEFYVDEADCIAQKKVDIGNAMDEVAAQGGSWSPQCAGELARVWSKWGCLGPVAAKIEAELIARTCELTHGEKEIGEQCSHGFFGDECSPGLACVDGMCRESPTFPVPKGDVCEYEYETLPCEEDTYCAWSLEGNNYCRDYPEAGQSCADSDAQCGPPSLGLVCNYETCEPLPAVGESCANTYQCRANAYCDGGQNMTCQLRQEIGEGCSTDAVCVPDARCQDNICTPAPAKVCDLANWP